MSHYQPGGRIVSIHEPVTGRATARACAESPHLSGAAALSDLLRRIRYISYQRLNVRRRRLVAKSDAPARTRRRTTARCYFIYLTGRGGGHNQAVRDIPQSIAPGNHV